MRIDAEGQGLATSGLFIPTLDEARIKAGGTKAYERIQRLRADQPLVKRAGDEFDENLYRCQYKSDAWDQWCLAHKGFCLYLRRDKSCQKWPEFVEKAMSALQGLGCSLSRAEVLAWPEVLYIGLVQAFVKPSYKVHVTELLPQLLAARVQVAA